MSSFRIDRQYVSFQTAETQPVFATNQQQKARQTLSDESSENGVDVSKLYDELYERLLAEHAEQAEQMLSKASDEAQAILEKARQDAEQIVSLAKADAATLKENLANEFEATVARRKSEEEKALAGLESSLRNDYAKQIDGMRGEVVSLVMEIVRKVIHIKLSQSDEIFTGLIREALEGLKQKGLAVIRVSPEDYARYFGTAREGPDIDTGEFKVTVIEEPGFSRGDLVVESEGEMINLSIDRQIDQIEKAFLN